MKVIIAWDGDHIGREVGRASLQDDVEGLRRVSQAIERGNLVWKSWVENNGGSMISYGGDEGRAEILAEKLAELPKIRSHYAQTVESTVSLGVGTKLSEADKALLAAKMRGGDKIVLYTPDIDQELEAAQKQQRSETDKLAEQYLSKADAPQGPTPPAMVEGSAAGFTGASPPSPPSVDTPQQEASEHSQGESMQTMVDNKAPAPESTHAAKDFEDQFHEEASKQDQKAQGQPVQQGDPQEQVKAQVVQVLQALKAQAPILEQIKQTAPDTYQAIMAMAQAVIAMAKQLNGDPQHTTVKELDDRARSQAEIQVPLPPEDEGGDNKDKKDDTKKSELAKMAVKDLKTGKRMPADKTLWPEDRHPEYDYTHLLSPENQQAGYKIKVVQPKGQAPAVRVYHGDFDPDNGVGEITTSYDPAVNTDEVRIHKASIAGPHRGRGVGGAMYEALFVHALKKLKAREIVGGIHSSMASRVHSKLAAKHGLDYSPEPNELGALDPRFGPKQEAGEFDAAHGPYRYTLKNELEPIAKSSLGWLPAFKHQQTGQVVPCKEGYHDLNELPDGNDQGWDSGFVDHGGAFYSREQARDLLQLNGTSSGALRAKQINETKKSEGEWHNCDEFGHCWGDGETGEHCLLCEETRPADELSKSDDQLEARIAHLASTTAGSSWVLPADRRTSAGKLVRGLKQGHVVVSPDQHDLSRWRATVINHAGRPSFHQVAPDHEGALRLAAKFGANLHGEPRRAFGKLDKASLSPNAGTKPPAAHHHLSLPVGSKVDPGPMAARKVGSIKVQHPETGKQGWIQARAGMIMSKDGHAISSRNPGGK